MSMKVSVKEAISFLKQTYAKWSDHNASRLGASVAFYSILSFAPLLVVMTGIIGLVFGHESAHQALVSEARQVIGDRGADTVNSLLRNAQKPASGIFASLIAFITLLFGASGVFTELQDALNIMWDAPKQEASGFMLTIKQRLFSFGMVLSVGFLLLVSLIISSWLAYLGHTFSGLIHVPSFVLQVINFALSFIVETALFALMFKYVPKVKVAWREVVVGAVGTAFLFTVGKFLLGIYLAKASVGSTYGAAGSLVAVVVWIYYSAQIFFFGAEFTRVYAERKRPEAVREPAPVSRTGEQTVAPAQTFQPVAAPALASSWFERPDPIRVSSASPIGISSSWPQPLVPEPPRAVNEAIRARLAHKPTKPRLLTAMAIGFLLGRLTGTPGRGRS
jgi:membrane protein